MNLLAMLRGSRVAVPLAICSVLYVSRAQAQDASVVATGSTGDASVLAGRVEAGIATNDDSGVAANAPGTTPDDVMARMRRMQLPEGFSVESPTVPRGAVWVRVVDASGQVVPSLNVRLGTMREGERLAPREGRTNNAGVAIFSGLETGTRNAYRASIENGGAKFSSDPFQLPTTDAGFQVQLVRMDVAADPRGILVTDARVEIGFQDDRIVVIQRVALVNVTALSMDGTMPHPTTWVPASPLRFSLPANATAFRADEQTMGDQRIEEVSGYAVINGSFPPTDPRQPIQLVWQSRVKIQAGDVPLDLTFPNVSVLAATVVAHAPVPHASVRPLPRSTFSPR